MVYNSSVQEIRNRKQNKKKFLKSMQHLKLSAYNSNVQRIKNRYKKNLKKYATFKIICI